MSPQVRSDAVLQIVRALYLAIALAFVALSVKLAGWRPGCWAALVVHCAYQAGRMATREKEMREFEERLRRLAKELGIKDDEP